MRVYRVNGIEHKVFDPEDCLPDGVVVRSDWKKRQVGDWVKADDDCVIQALRRGTMHKNKGKKREVDYIGTCTGSFPLYKTTKMDTSRRLNIYSFGGERTAEDAVIDRTNLTKFERVFVMYLARGMAPTQAYIKAFPTNDPSYASIKAATLTSTKRIRTAMKEELKPVMEDLGIDEKMILEGIKSEAVNADRADTRLKALFKLSDIMDLEDKNKTQVTQITGATFGGFSQDFLEKAERPKELKGLNE